MTNMVKSNIKSTLGLAIASVIAGTAFSSQALASADDITTALTSGKVYGDFRLRYENVDQDNPALDDANALTLRSMLGYTTGSYEGFSATVEFEDSRVVAGQDNYEEHPLARPAGYVVKGRSVVADPETTELDQAFVQYKTDMVTVKAGRQVLTYDNHRFVGHVGWRQDRQTFDALTVGYAPTKEIEVNYAYLDQRNRIFGEMADIDSEDHLLNLSFNTGIGKVTAYGYMLEETVSEKELDTYGLRFAGATAIDDKMKAIYAIEYAYQESEAAGNTLETDYTLLEGGLEVSGIKGLIGYEKLSSDEGSVGFQTPLATLHKFNGWADLFLITPTAGLVDVYASFSGKLGGGSWALAYHDFSADEGDADYGSEIDISYAKAFSKNYYGGIKYAMYSADDYSVDTDKLWLWVGAKF